jgi:hypothetical protein
MDSGTIVQKRQPKYLRKLEEFSLGLLVYVGIIEVEQLNPQSSYDGAQQNPLQQGGTCVQVV